MNELLSTHPGFSSTPRTLYFSSLLRRLLFHPLTDLTSDPFPRLLEKIARAQSAHKLNTSVNKFQTRLWKLPLADQPAQRALLAALLKTHTLEGHNASLRMAAASWLRLLVQSASLEEPQEIFVTLVTAATRAASQDTPEARNEQLIYLKLIFECFWPFRYPYASYTWKTFPANAIFYPLAPLIEQPDIAIQEELLGIFAELPELHDETLRRFVLPVALQLAASPSAEQRRRTTRVFALLNTPAAYEALQRLLVDSDPIVRASAKRAAESLRRD